MKQKKIGQKKPASKRSPQDATLRNITALKKRVAELEVIALRHRIEINECKRGALEIIAVLSPYPLGEAEAARLIGIINGMMGLK